MGHAVSGYAMPRHARMAVSKDQEIRKSLLTAEVVKHFRLGLEGLRIPLRRLQNQIALASPHLCCGLGTDETNPFGPCAEPCRAGLCRAVMDHVVLGYAIPCHAVLSCAMPGYAMPSCAMRCRAMPCRYCAMPARDRLCHAKPCHAMRCRATPCRTTPCRVMPRRAVPCHAERRGAAAGGHMSGRAEPAA